MEDSYDIAIVGAGPAGTTAAYAAARRGFRVALIDRHIFPRDKACGDGIGPGAVAVTRQLGLTGLFARDIPVNAVTVAGPDGIELDTTTSEMGRNVYGYIVPRRDFDKRLLDRALSEKADDFTGCRFVRTGTANSLRITELRNAAGSQPGC